MAKDLAAQFLDAAPKEKKKETRTIKTVPVDDDAFEIVAKWAREKVFSKKEAATWLINIADQRLAKLGEERGRSAPEAPMHIPRKAAG